MVGKQLDPLNPQTRQHIVLVAFLAWIGLGADGLSSACYGPEEAFLALGQHTHMGLYLALTTALTVFIISLAYNQVIELFPSGGGGYKAATKLIGPYAGLVSGSALIVDYVLTITISIASGMDALFSLFPAHYLGFKLTAEFGVLILLIVLNLRGMKESITVLMPIFLGFFLTHVILIVYGIGVHADALETLLPDTVRKTHTLTQETGWIFVASLFLRAYSLGGGTYTGIEAVSNNINMLREPRVRTGHWTMFYMATSLAFTAGGVILLYMLWNAQHVEGQTLNAVTFRAIINHMGLGSAATTETILGVVLALEAGLLVVAANTGFLGGPSVMANMAADRWMPRQFRQLSSRLVTQNGVLLMGAGAMLTLAGTRGQVALLVVLYSINVFLTFSLSLFGLCRYWLEQRFYSLHWRRSFALSAIGLTVTGCILVVTLVEKLTEGGWMTILITSAVIGLSLLIRRHYDDAQRKLDLIDSRYSIKLSWDDQAAPLPMDAQARTAIFLVGNNRGAGMNLLQWVLREFPDQFKNFVFVSVGEVDKQNFDGQRTIQALQTRIENSLNYFTTYCTSRGLPAAYYQAYGADPLDELMRLLADVIAKHPNNVCFASKLEFERENLWTRILHNQMPLAMQRKLNLAGHQLVIVPLKVPQSLETTLTGPRYPIK
ncbi:MAG: APC family permease [Nevskiaceae bacterium]|nr:MAG: APC family permease [Nevskiaceae bacterium]